MRVPWFAPGASRIAALAILSALPLWAADFATGIRPLIEAECLACHNAKRALGKVRLDTASEAAKLIVPGEPARSLLYTVLADDGDKVMPPGGALPPERRDLVRQWIAEGAAWPDGLVLGGGPKPDERELVARIRERILANERERPTEAGAYEETMPGANVSFALVRIPAGEFTMGSPEPEANRRSDEGPRRQVSVSAFWMGATEVVWDLYRLFMFPQLSGETRGEDELVDAVSRPTKPYVEMSFGMGVEGFPAISMTQHAARKFTQWLSARTGRFYRLPTEAEWEYACRAGAETAYSFGDDPKQLGEYAWSIDNADFTYRKAGLKKPNPWGLFDIHGNVAEWTLDAYSAAGYSRAAGPVADPYVKPESLYPRVARGGSWYDDADRLRCAARLGSDAKWKMQDPQLPQSVWYLTDAQWLGIRVVRPAEIPDAEAMFEFWNGGGESR